MDIFKNVIDTSLHKKQSGPNYDPINDTIEYTNGKGSIYGNEIVVEFEVKLFLAENKQDNVQHGSNPSIGAKAEASLSQDLKKMFADAHSFADIEVETTDHRILNAHKCILAARSTFFRKRIEEAVGKSDFNGIIRINISSKPLVAILHWLYTEELHPDADAVMEEIVDAAIMFDLPQLVKVLDRKLIDICTVQNMLRLCQVAQKNKMPHATEDISRYIRE